MSTTFYKLRIQSVRKETEDTVSIAFEVPDELKAIFSFTAGQYLTLKADINGEEVRRAYSLSSAPHENEWRVAVKQVEGGKFSTYANKSLKRGMELDVMAPHGAFVYQPEVEREQTLLLIAAGSGITPIISICKTALAEEKYSQVTLIYGNRSIQQCIFRDEIEDLKNKYMERFRVLYIFSREQTGIPIQQGRIDHDKMAEIQDHFLNDEHIDQVYLCGPAEMIESAKNSLMERGVQKDQIHFELFHSGNKKVLAEKTPSSAKQVQANVTVILDGDAIELSLTEDGIPILDAALEAGADLPFACKGGVCCTCKAKLIEGSARMDLNYSLEADEVEAGYILTCQAHPTSEKLIVSFDE